MLATFKVHHPAPLTNLSRTITEAEVAIIISNRLLRNITASRRSQRHLHRSARQTISRVRPIQPLSNNRLQPTLNSQSLRVPHRRTLIRSSTDAEVRPGMIIKHVHFAVSAANIQLTIPNSRRSLNVRRSLINAQNSLITRAIIKCSFSVKAGNAVRVRTHIEPWTTNIVGISHRSIHFMTQPLIPDPLPSLRVSNRHTHKLRMNNVLVVNHHRRSMQRSITTQVVRPRTNPNNRTISLIQTPDSQVTIDGPSTPIHPTARNSRSTHGIIVRVSPSRIHVRLVTPH